MGYMDTGGYDISVFLPVISINPTWTIVPLGAVTHQLPQKNGVLESLTPGTDTFHKIRFDFL